MATLTGRDMRVDHVLTTHSQQTRNTTYIADMLAPIVTVTAQSGIVPKYNQSFWFRNEAKLRAPGTKSEGGTFTVDLTDKYFCPRVSYRDEIPDEIRDATEAPFSMDQDSTDFVTDKIWLYREIAFATDFFTTGVWGQDKTGGVDFVQWSDYGASTPLIDLTTYQDSVEGLIAREPKKLVIGKQAWIKLKWHPTLLDSIKYTQTGQMSLDLFASLAEFDKVMVGRAITTTSPEGTAEASVTYTRVWGKNALMMYVPDRPGLRIPAAMYTYVWNRVPSALQFIKRMRDEEKEITIIEGNSYFDQKVVGANAGLFLSSVVA